MAKKSKSKTDLGLILKVVVLALGVAAFCMAFLVGVKFVTSKGDLVNDFTGFQTMFGYAETEEVLGKEITTGYLGFSFMAVLAFVLPLAGAVLSILKSKVLRLVGAGLMVVGAVLLFLLPSFVVLSTIEGTLTAVATALLDAATVKLGIGAILAGVFAALGGLVAGYVALTK